MLKQIDYDINILKVLVAHHFVIPAGTEMAAYARGRRMHGLIYVISGTTEYVFGDKKSVTLSSGDVAFLSADSAYHVAVPKGMDFEHYTVNFEGDANTFPEWLQSGIYVLHTYQPGRYQTGMDELAKTWQHMRTGYRVYAKARLLSLMADFISETMLQNVDVASYNRTLPARTLMEEHYDMPLTLAEMAQSCGMCEGSFRRTFTEVYHQSPLSALLSIRIEKSKEYLLLGCSLADTAARCGFSDVNYFIRMFHKNTGVTPGRYRKSL